VKGAVELKMNWIGFMWNWNNLGNLEVVSITQLKD
jgi:hypothetical protein